MTIATSQRWANAVREALASRYEFHSPLGRGGFATVWRVTNRQLGRVEALKVLADIHGEDREFVARFTREAQIAAALDHPNIVGIYEFGVTEGIFWYSMQLVEGASLLEEIEGGRRFTGEETVAILRQILAALETIHQRSVLHRDIKPANIILDEGGVPHLLDFGIARMDGASSATRTGTVVGTPAFMAPEALRGRSVDNRADLFAVGVTAYQMLSGRLPYANTESTQLLIERVTQPPVSLTLALPEGNRALAAVIMRALATDPAARFGSAAEMASALETALHDRSSVKDFEDPWSPPLTSPSASATPASPETILLRPRRRRGLAIALAAALAIFALGLGWLASTRSAEGPRSLTPAAPGAARASQPDAVEPPPRNAPGGPATSLPAAGVATTAPAQPPVESRLPSPPMRPAMRRAVTQPQLLDGPLPVVPSELAAECGGVDIPLKLEIDAAGKVRAVRVLGSSRGPCLAIAEAAVRAYNYQPGLDAAGEPTAASLALSVHLPP